MGDEEESLQNSHERSESSHPIELRKYMKDPILSPREAEQYA